MNIPEFLKDNYTDEQVYLLTIVSSSLVLDSYISGLDEVPPTLSTINDVLVSIREDLTPEKLLEVSAMMAALESV